MYQYQTESHRERSDFDLVSYIINSGVEHERRGRNVMISCPFHYDKKPSMVINKDNGYCFGCGKRYGYKEIVNHYGGDVSLDRYKTDRVEIIKKEFKPPDPRIIDLASKTLLKMSDKITYLLNRGIKYESILKYKIGYLRPQSNSFTMPRYVIPTYGSDGEIVTAVYRQDPSISYEDTHPENKRYVYHWGAKAYTYGLDTADTNRSIVYTSGQFDTIILKQMGINAVGAPGEANVCSDLVYKTWNTKVFVLMDRDQAGIKATQKLCGVFNNAIAVEWEDFDGKDVTDMYTRCSEGDIRIKRMLERVGYPF